MPVKKSELYGAIWASCDKLRGGMDASQYKDYVLVLLFVKYVSDRYAGDPHATFTVPPGGSYADLVALKGDKEIGDKINQAVTKLAEANGLEGVIDKEADFNDEGKLGRGREMVERLSGLVGIFEHPALDFGGNRAEGDDLLGDAYEYLLRNFATQSGKSKGQFYTPAEVSRVMAQVVGVGRAADNAQSVYDPTCGSGSLLLKAHAEAKSRTGFDLALYGQEKDVATAGLARMNMILHDCQTADVWKDNTLTAPHWTDPRTGGLKLFDFAVANPPFSDKAWLTGLNPHADEFGRFGPGVPPAKNGDYAYLLHLLASLKPTSKGAVVLPHGVLFRGHAEAAVRKNLLRRGVIKGVIGLPANLFYGTGIPACLVVLDKEHAATRKGVFLLDASKGFRKDGNKNRLREQDIHRIVDTFTRQQEVPGYSRLVPLAEIADPRHDYNLNLPRYLDGSALEDVHDLDAHLNGGLPAADVDALAAYWQVLPGVRAVLFGPADRPGYFALTVPAGEVRAAVFGHPEFRTFEKLVTDRYDLWRAEHLPALCGIAVGDSPKKLVGVLSESLLDRFRGVQLLDPYDIYQHLMDYWAATMGDDVALVAAVGWEEAARLRPLPAGSKEKPDLVAGRTKYRAELIPPPLVIARYFADEQEEVDRLTAIRAAKQQAADDYREEHTAEEGLLLAAADDDGNVTEVGVRSRLRQTGPDGPDAEERAVLEGYRDRLKAAKVALAAAAEAEDALTDAVVDKYAATDGRRGANAGGRRQVAGGGGDRGAGRVGPGVHRPDRPGDATGRAVRRPAAGAARRRRRLHREGGRPPADDGGDMDGVRPGYQRTEVGVIPEKWTLTPLGSLLHFKNGVNADKSAYGRGSPFINVLEVITKSHLGQSDIPGSVLLPRMLRELYAVQSGDILFNRTSETQEDVGLAAVYTGGGGVVFGGFVIRGRPKSIQFDGQYAGFAFRAPVIRRQIIARGQGAVRANIGQSELSTVLVPLPPLAEQRAIAAALADVDGRLGALDRRLAKARDVKQAVMQQLLTGRTRLPGFTGDWTTCRLGEMWPQPVTGCDRPIRL